MAGGLVMAFVLVVALPVIFMVTGALAAVVVGESLWRDGEARAEGSEPVDLNR